MATRQSGRRRIVPVLVLVVFTAIAFSLFLDQEGTLQQGVRQLTGGGKLDPDKAAAEVQKLGRDSIAWTERIVQERAQLQLTGERDLKASLPDIATFALPVAPAPGPNTVVAEIFASTEKSGSGPDGWMVEIAEAFNAAGVTLPDGRAARVAIRKIASGTGQEFISARKYVPAGFSPSNQLWVEMVAASGVPVKKIRDRTVGNIAGVVMRDAVFERIEQAYGKVDVPAIVDAVVQGQLAMGYTNPFASSTGLNFLVTVLQRFSGGDPGRMLAPDVASSFEGFQRGVPFVALTTLQMRDSVEKSGSLDAFVMEYQTYVKTPSLQRGYRFVPFGVRHDNPLYAVGEVDGATAAVLEKYAAFAEQPRYSARATEYGFNPTLDYQPAFAAPDGALIVQAQRLWKEKKNAGRPIAAVFVADVSGSMAGSRLSQLKRALLAGADFIQPVNAIGLVTFSHEVTTLLPVKPFDLLHKAAFHAAVQQMEAKGNTAMYDGIVAGLSMLIEAQRANPGFKPMLFVLSDGETNRGLPFDEVARLVEGLGVPIYTIGYEANLAELGKVSSLVEAASINSSEAEVEYKIGALLNAQM